MTSLPLLYLAAKISADQAGIPKSPINAAQFGSLFSAVLGIAGIMAVIFIIVGGLRYTLSQGNAADLQKAKDIIVYAVVGLVIVMFGFVIVQYVTGRIFL